MANPSPQSSSASKMSKCKEARRYLPATVAWILLLCTTALFFIFPAQWFYNQYSIWILIAEGFVALIVIANFTLATFMDPGVIPKAMRGEDDNDDARAPLYKTVDVQGISVRMKWCVTCQFYRPPRCSHCSVCNNCIETFDHHCPWVNNCIGRRNYRFFFMFLMSLSVHMISIFSLSLIYLLQHLQKMSDVTTVISISVMVVISVLFIPICGLTGFHIVLVSRGRTTNEQVTGKYRGGYNPFSRGCCYNCWFTLCGPLYPGLVRAKRNYAENIAIVYRTSNQGDGPPYHDNTGSGNQVKVYLDNGTSKSKSGNLSLSSLHSPRDYRQMMPSRDTGEHELGLQASQSLDCEPTPPMQRQGSKNNFYLSKDCSHEDSTGLNHVRHLRFAYSHGSPHPNRQRNYDGRSSSQTPDSMVSPEATSPKTSFSSPTIQQKIRAIGGVPTPFVPASPIIRRSNPPTPTHTLPGREFIGGSYLPKAPATVRVQNPSGSVPSDTYSGEAGERRFLSENELIYESHFQGHGLMGRGREASGPIRELASSPQRGVYQWKDNSPTGPLLDNGNHTNSTQNYYHSNPTSPVQHNNFSSSNSSVMGNSGTNNRDYYNGDTFCPPTYLVASPISPEAQQLDYDQQLISNRPNPLNRRPMSFVRALEMAEMAKSVGDGVRTQQIQNDLRCRNSPAGTPKGSTQTPFTSDNQVRASVYDTDMNYEISV